MQSQIRPAVILVAMWVLSGPALPRAHGQCAFEWHSDGGPSAVDGEVLDMLVHDDGGGPALYAIGRFTVAGDVRAEDIARFDGTSWSPVGSGLVVQSDYAPLAVFEGDLIAAAGYVGPDGNGLGRISRWNGSSWSSMGTLNAAEVRCFAVYEGQLFAGGWFNLGEPDSQTGVLRWTGSDWEPVPGGPAPTVLAMTVWEGDLLVSGWFPWPGSITTGSVLRFDGTNWTPMGDQQFAPAARDFTTFNGQLIASGTSPNEDGTDSCTVSRWDGTRWVALGSGIYEPAGPLVVHEGSLYAGAVWDSFKLAGVDGPRAVVRWDGTTWLAGPDQEWGLVRALEQFNNTLIAGGAIWSVGDRPDLTVIRLSGDEWVPLRENRSAPSGVRDMCSYNGGVVALGPFLSVSGEFTSSVAQWRDGVWSPVAGPSGSSPEVATSFRAGFAIGTKGDPANQHGASVWDGITWEHPGGGVDGSVYALLEDGTDLIAAGSFTLAGDTPAASIARWDGEHWHAYGPGLPGTIYAATKFEGNLVAAGLYQPGDGTSEYRISMWDGAQWTTIAAGPEHRTTELAVWDGALIASHYGVRRWQDGVWSTMGPALTGKVGALAPYNGRLIAGGYDLLAGTDRVSLAQWTGTSWTPLDNDLPESVDILLVHDGELFVGGNFTFVGDLAAIGVVRWSPVGGWMDCDENAVLDACDLAADPSADTNGDGVIDACACTADGGCASDDPCVVPACIDGVCTPAPRLCDDGDECTEDACTPGIGCAHFSNGCRGACMYPEGSCRHVTAQACATYVCNVTELSGTHAAACYGDTFGDGTVDANDRNQISWHFASPWFDTICAYDLDGNGLINPADRGVVAANIGQCNPLPDWQNGTGLNHGQPDTRFSPGTFSGIGASCSEFQDP